MTVTERQTVIATKDKDGNTVMHFPVTSAKYVEGAVRTVNGIEPDANGDVLVAGLPIGHEWWTINPNIPVGCLPLFGGTFSRTAYADLWAWVQTQGSYLITEAEWQAKATANDGNVPFYSDGDGSTTFRVPSLACWVRGANGVEEVGSYLEAGLPNITGELRSNGFGLFGPTEVTLTGAFTGDTNGKRRGGDGSSTFNPQNLQFDASNCSSIYGNSDTVQPPSIVGMWLVKAFGTVSNVGNQDIADVSAGLTRVETKMDEYTDNVAYIDSFIVESWRSGTEWYRKYSDGTIEQGGYVSTTTATYPLPFANTDYTLLTGSNRGGSNNSGNFYYVTAWTTTGFKHALDSNQKVWWYAVGQGAT